MGTANHVVIGAGLALAATAWVTANTSHGPQKPLIASPNGALIATVADRPDWCQDEIQVSVYGKDDDLFKDDRVELQRLLGLVRATMSFECARAKRIVMNGFVDDVFIFRGVADRDNAQGEWVLFEIPVGLIAEAPKPLPPSPVAEKVPDPGSVAACDRLAAHPDDPTKPSGTSGVGDDDLRAGEAVQACEQALELKPEDPRIRYQLARAYLMFDRSEEGLVLMTEAAEEGHAVAMSSLGDIALYGLLDDEPDPEGAKLLYQRAAKAGFKPAAAHAAAIVANPPEEKEQPPGPPELYREDYAALLMAGRPLTDAQPFMQMVPYATQFTAGIREHCPKLTIRMSGDEIGRRFPIAIAKHMGGLIGALAFGNANTEGAFETLKQEGMDDGYAVAVSNGCESPKLRNAFVSMERFLSE